MGKKRYVVLSFGLCAASAALGAFMTYDLVRGWPKSAAPQPDQGILNELAALRAEAADLRKQLADLEMAHTRDAEERAEAKAKAAAEAEAVPKLPPPPYPLWNHRSVEEWAAQGAFRMRVYGVQHRHDIFPMRLREIMTLAFQYGQLTEEDAQAYRLFVLARVASGAILVENFEECAFWCPSVWAIDGIIEGRAPDELRDKERALPVLAHHIAYLPTHTVRPYLPQLREIVRRVGEGEDPASAGPLIGALAWAHSDSEGYAFLTRYRDKAPLMREAIRYAAWLGNGPSRQFLERTAAHHPKAEIRAEAEEQLEIWDQVVSELSGANPAEASEPPSLR